MNSTSSSSKVLFRQDSCIYNRVGAVLAAAIVGRADVLIKTIATYGSRNVN